MSEVVDDKSEEIIENVESAHETSKAPLVPTPSQLSRKRKSTTPLPDLIDENHDDDDGDDSGSICSICLDNWQLAGPHRITSLKCGHLFGNSCIKRWLNDNSARNKLCPQCKKRANIRDFRFIYAKRVTAIDNSEEVRLREQLKEERDKYSNLELEYSLNINFERVKFIDLQERLSDLQQILASYSNETSSSPSDPSLQSDREQSSADV